MTVNAFMLDQIKAISANYAVTVVADFSDSVALSRELEGVDSCHVPIARRISIVSDIKALTSLYLLFRKSKFQIVHSVTPKAGLLAMCASWLARVPFRFHTFTGQVWATQSGLFRWLLKSMDKITFFCSTRILVDSPSQRDFLLKEGVVNESRSSVLGEGSISGVDIHRFRPDVVKRAQLRDELKVPQQAFVFLFLGRLNAEKGVSELVEAFNQLCVEHADAYLWLIGPDEGGVMNRVRSGGGGSDKHVVYRGYTTHPEHFMSAADVFCLPSHREGFGSVIIEAAASGLPSIGSNIYGISDAIVDGETGLLHEVGNVPELKKCMETFINDRECVVRLGNNAKDRAVRCFAKELLVNAFVEYYAQQTQSSIEMSL